MFYSEKSRLVINTEFICLISGALFCCTWILLNKMKRTPRSNQATNASHTTENLLLSLCELQSLDLQSAKNDSPWGAGILLQTWTRTRIATNSNSPQSPNKIIIRNFKNSKPLESSKHKKHDQIWTKITIPQLNNHEKTNKKGGKKEEGNLPKPLPSFSFFRPLLSL